MVSASTSILLVVREGVFLYIIENPTKLRFVRVFRINYLSLIPWSVIFLVCLICCFTSTVNS